MRRTMMIVLAVLCVGCSKPVDALIGTWKVDRYYVLDGETQREGQSMFLTWTFKAGGVGYIDSVPMHYRHSGTFLEIESDETIQYNIKELTDKTLKVCYPLRNRTEYNIQVGKYNYDFVRHE